jgi:hypothetical protein
LCVDDRLDADLDLRQPFDQAMLGDDPSGRLWIALDAVLWSQSRSGLQVARVGPQQIGELDEQLLEAGGRDDLQKTAGSSVAFQKVCHTSRGL